MVYSQRVPLFALYLSEGGGKDNTESEVDITLISKKTLESRKIWI